MINSHIKPIKFKTSKKEIKKIEYEYDTMIKTAETDGVTSQDVSAFFRREEELLWAHIRQAKTSVLQQRFVQSILNNPTAVKHTVDIKLCNAVLSRIASEIRTSLDAIHLVRLYRAMSDSHYVHIPVNIETMNILLGLFARFGDIESAQAFYATEVIQRHNLKPTTKTLKLLLYNVAMRPEPERVADIWNFVQEEMESCGLFNDLESITITARALMKGGKMNEAHELIQEAGFSDIRLSVIDPMAQNVILYTDASFKQKQATYSFVCGDDNTVMERGEIVGIRDSNEAELYAILMALSDVHDHQSVTIRTDCLVAMGKIAKLRTVEPKRHNNVYVSKIADELRRIKGAITIEHVKAHSIDISNIHADFFAGDLLAANQKFEPRVREKRKVRAPKGEIHYTMPDRKIQIYVKQKLQELLRQSANNRHVTSYVKFTFPPLLNHQRKLIHSVSEAYGFEHYSGEKLPYKQKKHKRGRRGGHGNQTLKKTSVVIHVRSGKILKKEKSRFESFIY
jgi:ribonuclease HI